MDISVCNDADLTTLVVVFVVEPENQEKLVQLLKEGAETVMSKQPGYVAASFLKSKDGRRVFNIAQWRSIKDIEAYRTRPAVGAFFDRVKALAPFEPLICDVAYVHHA